MEADVLRYYGIVKNIEIIGEAANMLTSLFKETHSEVEWRPISNMRNFLVHEYFQVDNDTVWAVFHGDIVELSHYHVKHHHQDKADGKTDGAEIAVLTTGGFWNQFLDNHIEHGASGKGQHIWQHGNQQRGQ